MRWNGVWGDERHIWGANRIVWIRFTLLTKGLLCIDPGRGARIDHVLVKKSHVSAIRHCCRLCTEAGPSRVVNRVIISQSTPNTSPAITAFTAQPISWVALGVCSKSWRFLNISQFFPELLVLLFPLRTKGSIIKRSQPVKPPPPEIPPLFFCLHNVV